MFGKGIHTLLFAFLFVGFLGAQNSCLQTAKTIYKVDSAITLLKGCLPQLANDTAALVNTTCYLSKLLNRSGKFEQSKKLLNNLLPQLAHPKHSSLKGLVLLHLGNVYQASRISDEALKNYLAALKLFEESNDQENTVGAYTNLAEFYRSVGNYENAQKYIVTGLNLYKTQKLNSVPKLIKLYNRYAAIANESNKLDSSTYYTLTALKLSQQSNDKYNEATSWNELGFTLKNYRMVDSSYKCYQRAIDLWKSIGAETEAVHAMFNQVQLLTHNHYGHKKLIPYYYNIINYVHEKKMEYWLNEVYFELASCYFFIGDSIKMHRYKAYSAHENIRRIQAQYNANINDIQEKYENEKYKNEIIEVSQTLKETEESLSFIKKENIFIYTILGIISILLLVIFLLLKKINKANKELKLKHIEKDSLIQEIHHRVKNNLQFVSSLINMQINTTKTESEKENLQDVSRRIKSMALVHQMLYNREDLEGVEMKNYIGELIRSIEELVNTKGIAIAFDINCDDVKFSTIRSIAVGIIVSELISNSIKHGFVNIQDPKIAIQLIQDVEGNIQLSYNDNGIGLKNLNTNNGETLGMRLIDIFSRQIKGNYTFDNNNGLLFKLNFKNESAV